MTTDTAFDVLREHGNTECTAQFWVSETPARHFSSLRECLRSLADENRDEPLPDVHIHAATGDIAINGPQLESLIRVANPEGRAA